jgi:hypothetical protein
MLECGFKFSDSSGAGKAPGKKHNETRREDDSPDPVLRRI